MKNLLVIILIIFSFTGIAYAYPESKMNDCISSSLNNPATKSFPMTSIKNYCDCALKEIIDKNKDIRESGYQCALRNLS
tara:strand:- start:559 stop:795 length:237 start_codon:yes stop_codon:yes gene_type:complete